MTLLSSGQKASRPLRSVTTPQTTIRFVYNVKANVAIHPAPNILQNPYNRHDYLQPSQPDRRLSIDIREETGIDLADLSAGGLFKIDQHMPSLVKVLAVYCQDEIKEWNLSPREFARAIKGNVLRSAREAVLNAVESFFPPSSW